MLARLESGDLDAALLALPNLSDRLQTVPLYTERYMLAFPSGHWFAKQDAIRLSDLEGVDYLKRVHCEFVDHFEALGSARPLGVNVRYTSEREDWVQAMVAAGIGCTIMPESLPTIEGIGVRPLTAPEVSRTVAIATVRGRPFSPPLQTLLRAASRYPWPGADVAASS